MVNDNNHSGNSQRLSRRAYVSALGLAAGLGTLGTANAASVSVGNGSYKTTLPAGESEPQSTQYTTSNVSAPLPTNDWWSTLLWFPYSEPLFAHPLAFDANGVGLDVSNPTEWTYTTDSSNDPHQGNVAMMDDTTDLTIGHTATSSFEDVRCDGYSDWSVDAVWGDGTSTSLSITLAQGSPYVFCEYSGGGAALSFPSAPTVFADDGNVLGVSINGHAYGLYAPSGTTWSGKGTTELTSDLAGAGYLTVAALPEATSTALADFEQYAYNFLTDTQISWTYDETASEVITTYTVSTSAKAESSTSGTLSALFPHQHKNTSETFEGYTYESARGTMQTVTGVSFTTTHSFCGILPFLPDEGTYDKTELQNYVDDEESSRTLVRTGPENPGDGTYWTGKNYGRLAQIIPIADQLGDDTAADYFLNGDQNTKGLKDDLELWFDANSSGKTTSEDVFYYNQNWGTLIGYNDSFGSGANINDHHFHYGYYVRGAAEVARKDPTWAQDSNWGGMVDLLIRDFANPDRSDSMFPFLRHFSPYEGHSWADGGGSAFVEGNNQESSSEALNAYASMILWGEFTNNTEIRDAGVFLYTQELSAVREYWFDVDNENQPSGWNYDYAAMVWGNGYKYTTWWTTDTEAIHGINMLPMCAHMEFLGWDTQYAQSNYDELVANDVDGEVFSYWPDIMWMFRAFSDVTDAKNKWQAKKSSYPVEFGETKAHTYHWIYNMDGMGTPDPSITADHPLTAVFDDGTAKTYIAYNGGSSPVTVTFSDGTALDVPANSMATSTGSGGGGSGDSTAPTAPSNLTSTGKTDTSVDLSWDPSSDDGTGIDHYNVYIDGTKDQEVTAGTTSTTVSNLSTSTTYDFYVTAVDGAGNESSASNTISVTTDSGSTGSTAPTIDSFSVTNVSNGGWASFNVNWTVSDADGDLSSVVVELRQNGVQASKTISVSGSSASDTTNVRDKKGSGSYDVMLTVTDAADNTKTQTETVLA
ncbi:glycosyl hydrolase [Natrinema gelatinilyticum]|uniref:glycosyl hydrolase n=1 Tax=Natrinema gelatinilyticum TaxID=2961571 RepID=UPI0020C1DDAF|nr:glycosyl hydrolase [Natrinema gelatinilyticum]